MDFRIQKTDAADQEDRQALLDRLIAYNDSKTGINDCRPLAILITDASGVSDKYLLYRSIYTNSARQWRCCWSDETNSVMHSTVGVGAE